MMAVASSNLCQFQIELCNRILHSTCTVCKFILFWYLHKSSVYVFLDFSCIFCTNISTYLCNGKTKNKLASGGFSFEHQSRK